MSQYSGVPWVSIVHGCGEASDSSAFISVQADSAGYSISDATCSYVPGGTHALNECLSLQSAAAGQQHRAGQKQTSEFCGAADPCRASVRANPTDDNCPAHGAADSIPMESLLFNRQAQVGLISISATIDTHAANLPNLRESLPVIRILRRSICELHFRRWP